MRRIYNQSPAHPRRRVAAPSRQRQVHVAEQAQLMRKAGTAVAGED